MKDKVEVDSGHVQDVVREYDASGGKEFFIAFEEPENDVLIGYIRLRIPSGKAHRREVDASTAMIRELHVYGPEVPVGRRYPGAWQHSGLGRKLLRAAEQKAAEAGANKILVLSALGTREYYERVGYRPVGPYMGKYLN